MNNTSNSTKKNNKLIRNTLGTLYSNELRLYLLSKKFVEFLDFVWQKTLTKKKFQIENFQFLAFSAGILQFLFAEIATYN